MRRGEASGSGRAINACDACDASSTVRSTATLTDNNDRQDANTMPNENRKQRLNPMTRAERAEERTNKATESLMRSDHRTHETTMPKHKLRTKVSRKSTLTTAKVDPELIARYFAATKRDANAQQRYAPPIINHRLCR